MAMAIIRVVAIGIKTARDELIEIKDDHCILSWLLLRDTIVVFCELCLHAYSTIC